MMEQAYVYQWTEKTTGKWYIGSRTRKGCHPGDGYICSSKTVKPMIEANRENWIRDILFVGNPIKALEIESFVLCEMRAKDNDTSYNLHNQDMKWSRLGMVDTESARAKKSKSRMGEGNPSFGKRGQLSPNWGRKHPPRSEETKRKLSEALKGKQGWTKGMKMPPMTEEARLKISKALKGRVSPMKGRKNPAVKETNKKRIGIKRPEHSAWMTGRTWKCLESTCVHCGKTGRGGNMTRFHFDNCKQKGNTDGSH
jgi:hypothetical protein